MKPYFKDKINESIPSLVLFLHETEQNEESLKKLEDDLKNKYGDKLNVVRVDVSYDRHLIKEYKINEYPTWILFDKGEELMRESGFKSFNDLVEMIDRIM